MKKLLAVAVATAFAAPAMADTTLYGKLHSSIHMTDSGASSDGTQVNVSSNSSRIGVKGKEKISDSLDVVYGLEWGLNVVDTGGLSDRNKYVGLKGSWGSLLAGRIDTPEKKVGRKAELFGDTLGDARSITSAGISDDRFNDGLFYVSPKLGGGFSYSLATTNSDDGTTQGVSANAMYKTKSLVAGIGFAESDGNGKTTRIAGKYDYGKGKISALVQKDEDLSGTTDADRDVWGLGATMKTASGAVKIQTYTAGDTGSSSNTGATLTAIGYDHKLSKRTTLYAQYAQMKNQANASYSLGGGVSDSVSPAATGEDPSGIALGIIHKF